MATFPNGMIPADAMTALSVGGFLLPAAAQNFESWKAVARNAGWNLTITSAADAFRTYGIQERIFRARYTTTYLAGRPTKVWQNKTWWLRPGQATAAVPGTSNHGKGLAVDIKNAGGFSGAFYKWMAETGPAFGWSNTEGRSINEPWHWVNDNVARGAIGSIVDKIPVKESDDFLETLMAATPIRFFSWKTGNTTHIFEANLLSGTYWRIDSMNTLRDRKSVLTGAGIPWENHPGGSGETPGLVINGSAYGRQIG